MNKLIDRELSDLQKEEQGVHERRREMQDIHKKIWLEQIAVKRQHGKL